MQDRVRRHLTVQNMALRTLNEIADFIKPGLTEKAIARQCLLLMQQQGLKDWWYHNVPALVLAGDRSTLSVSGKDYAPSEIPVQEGDLITIDLSPQADGCWGDCARSYPVGAPGLMDGIKAEKKLHEHMRRTATPQMTLGALYTIMNTEIENLGYRNLDFKGNLGHSIETDIDKRRYIEANNETKLGDLFLFTFEPHIARKGSRHGFKRENIYYFDNGAVIPLGDPELLDVI